MVLVDGKISSLLAARVLSAATLDRINWQFYFIMGLNTLLIALGLTGGITPRLAALLHNLGTVLVTGNSIRRLLPESAGEKVLELPLAASLAMEDAADDKENLGHVTA